VSAARHAVRVLLADPEDRVLLFSAVAPEDGRRFWFPPGGGLEEGEDARAAAVREVREETGLELRADELGDEVFARRHVFTWRGEEIDQRERWFLVRVAAFAPDASGLTAAEHEELSPPRWWSLDELAAETADRLVPDDLAARLRGWLSSASS
jgi:8-oxo-dGTP pyrophosphatase MutT (NUDIX family)